MSYRFPGGDFDKFRQMYEQILKSVAPLLEQYRQLANSTAFMNAIRDTQRAAELVRQARLPYEQIEQMASKFREATRVAVDFHKLQDFWKRGLPDNWIGLGAAQEVGELLDLMQETGWCVIWTPRAEIVRAILDASDEQARSQVLEGATPRVIEDIRVLLDQISSTELEEYADAGRKSIAAFEDGHVEAAQAFAAAALSGLIGMVFQMKFIDAKSTFAKNPMEVPWVDFRRFAVLDMVARSLMTFHADRGDPIPGKFSRHASMHSVSPQQYTRENSLAALMLLGPFLKETDLLIQKNEADDDG